MNSDELCDFCSEKLSDDACYNLDENDENWCSKCKDLVDEHRDNEHENDMFDDCPICQEE